jgi:hypothetical protein
MLAGTWTQVPAFCSKQVLVAPSLSAYLKKPPIVRAGHINSRPLGADANATDRPQRPIGSMFVSQVYR